MRTTATSSSGARASTRAICVAPPARRIVTVLADPTTWTLVRIVSGEMKNPVPSPSFVSTRTTAGSDRLIRSSSGSSGGFDNAASLSASALAFDAAYAASTRAATSARVESGCAGAEVGAASAAAVAASSADGAGLLVASGATTGCERCAFQYNVPAIAMAPATTIAISLTAELIDGSWALYAWGTSMLRQKSS